MLTLFSVQLFRGENIYPGGCGHDIGFTGVSLDGLDQIQWQVHLRGDHQAALRIYLFSGNVSASREMLDGGHSAIFALNFP